MKKKHEELFSHRNGYCGCLEKEYKERNGEIIDKLLKKELTTDECLKALNKSLGAYLVKKGSFKSQS